MNYAILALLLSFTFLFALFLFRALLRKEWAAGVAFVLFFSILLASFQPDFLVALATNLILYCLTVFLLIRLGLLAMVAGAFFNVFIISFPLTTQSSAWYAGLSLAGILLMAVIAFYGFYTSLGGGPVFGGAVFEE